MCAAKRFIASFCFLTLAAIAAQGAERQPGPPLARQASELTLAIDSAALERQYAALSAMPAARVTYSDRGPISYVEGETGVVITARSNLRHGDKAPEVLSKFKDALLATGAENLTVRTNDISGPFRDLRLDQSIRGIPVARGFLAVRIDESTGLVKSMRAFFLPDRGLPMKPSLTAQQAAQALVKTLESTTYAKKGSVKTHNGITLVYYGVHPGAESGHLAWEVPTSYIDSEGALREERIWVDAIDGSLPDREPATEHAASKVYLPSPPSTPTLGFPAGLTEMTEAQILADPVAKLARENLEKAQIHWAALALGYTPREQRIVVRYVHLNGSGQPLPRLNHATPSPPVRAGEQGLSAWISMQGA